MLTFNTYRFIALLMAFVLFFSTSGLSMDMHFCKSKLKRVNLFGKAKTCEEVAKCYKSCGKKLISCHADGEDHKGCCNNSSITFNHDFNFCSLDTNIHSQSDLKILSTVNFSFEKTQSLVLTPIQYKNYKPPLLSKDITVLVQSFLL